MAQLFRILILLLIGFAPIGAKAQDFSARFAMVDTRVARPDAVPAMATLSGTLALRPSLPATVAGWTFEDQSFVAFGTQVEDRPISAYSCGNACDGAMGSRVRASMAVGNAAGLVYVSGGLTARDGDAVHALPGALSEKWTAGIGFTYNATSQVRFWGQFDRVAFSDQVFGSFAGIPAPTAGFSLKGGLSVPLDGSLFTNTRAMMAADDAARQRFLEWLKSLFAPGKFMP